MLWLKNQLYMMPLQIEFEFQGLLDGRDSFVCYKRDKCFFSFFLFFETQTSLLHEFLELLNNYKGPDGNLRWGRGVSSSSEPREDD